MRMPKYGLGSAQSIHSWVVPLLLCFHPFHLAAEAEKCDKAGGIVYGEDGYFEQLVACSLARTNDLDLTPQSEQMRLTSKPLVEQGLSNKTSILHARLGGLWSLRRADFVECAWQCSDDQLHSSTVLQLTNLSLEVIERLDISVLTRGHSKLVEHKPCRALNLPTWMCRGQKSVFRTTRTWVNKAFFNVSLSQNLANGQSRPVVDKVELLFTCPESFRQKITYSPSASYVLAGHLNLVATAGQQRKQRQQQQQQAQIGQGAKLRQEKSNFKRAPQMGEQQLESVSPSLSGSHSIQQSGRVPALPPYHNSVRLIQSQTVGALRASFQDCLQQFDSDLSVVRGHNSFGSHKYNSRGQAQTWAEEEEEEEKPLSECSNRRWITSRLELSEQANLIQGQPSLIAQAHSRPIQAAKTNTKRSGYLLDYPSDPNQLLNPYGYYYPNSGLDQMIDDAETGANDGDS